MRWLLFFLVVLNGLTFAWFSFDQSKSAAVTSVVNQQVDFSSVGNVELITELPAKDLKERDTRILVEPQVVVDVQLVSSTVENVITQPAGVVNAECAMLGPFSEMVSAKQLKARLEERGYTSKVVLFVRQLPAINWVYIEPHSTRKEALATLRKLQAMNVDSFLISEGEYANGISLGFFSKLDSARAVMNERKAQGFDVKLTKRTREEDTYWAALDAAMTARVDESLIYSVAKEFPDLKKQEKSCSDVALLQIIE